MIHRESDIEIRFSAPPLIQGYREADGNRMWRIPLRTTATIARVKDDGTIMYNSETQRQRLDHKLAELSHVANNVYELPTIAQAIRYLHAACGFPVKSTWIKATISRGEIMWAGHSSLLKQLTNTFRSR